MDLGDTDIPSTAAHQPHDTSSDPNQLWMSTGDLRGGITLPCDAKDIRATPLHHDHCHPEGHHVLHQEAPKMPQKLQGPNVTMTSSGCAQSWTGPYSLRTERNVLFPSFLGTLLSVFGKKPHPFSLRCPHQFPSMGLANYPGRQTQWSGGQASPAAWSISM